MAHIDIFNDSAFTAVELTKRWGTIPHVPQRIGQMGIFETDGVTTTDFSVERTGSVLGLIPYTDREEAAPSMTRAQRKLFRFSTGHFPLERTVRPSEIQNVRSFGSESELQMVDNIVGDKVKEMRPSHLATLEFQRLNAIKGTIVDSDGTTVIEDLYSRFSLTQDEVDFELDSDTTEILIKCLTVKRHIEDGLGGLTYDGVVALCGSTFFQNFITHPKVKEAYDRWQDGAFLRDDVRFKGFPYAGIHWEEYRGAVGGITFIDDEEVYFFPVGVPDLFITRFAPANMMSFVNTKGLPLYVSQKRLDHDRGVQVVTESNPMSICLRPEAVVKGIDH